MRTEPILLSQPSYLRLNGPQLAGTTVTLREHIPLRRTGTSDTPLVVVTLHPGFVAGSYTDRDYFERMVPYLFGAAPGAFRLRVFTINHPGYDLPDETLIDKQRMQPYSIHLQPGALNAALTWLLREHLAHERDIRLVAYGHSMGGLALSRHNLAQTRAAVEGNGRFITTHKILSAPALVLHPYARSGVRRLDALNIARRTLGRLPFYDPVAIGLYRSLAPRFFERDAPSFSLDAGDDFYRWEELNPFVLLQQGRELIRFDVENVGGAILLDEAHLILAREDLMIDLTRTLALAEQASQLAALHLVDSTHLLERAAPADVAAIVLRVVGAALTQPRAEEMARE